MAEDVAELLAPLRENLRYDPETGLLWWLKRGPNRNVNSPAGHLHKKYLRITLNYKRVMAHVVAWLLHYGELPKRGIDHENRNGHDNRICNLRDVTRSVNCKNRKRRSDNSSGVNGVHWNSKLNKWQVAIGINGVQTYLGVYERMEDAIRVRREHEPENEYHPSHGRVN